MLKLFLLVGCIIINTTAAMTMFPLFVNTITNTHLQCLKNMNYLERAYIQFIPSIEESVLKQSSIQPHAIIFIMSYETLNSTLTISRWTHHILSHNYTSLWITWQDNGQQKINCQGFWQILVGLKKLSPNFIGVFMGKQRWNENEYLNKDFCQRLSQFSLFFEEEEFKPFQGWNTYQLKVKSTLTGICGLDEIQEIML